MTSYRLPSSQPAAVLRLCTVFLLMIAGAAASGAMIDVNAKVLGTDNAKIGTINTTNGSTFRAKFELSSTYAFLDEWFDFRWVQLLTKNELDGVAQPPDADGAYPQIDPQPIDNPAPDDGPAPFYYNGKEWQDGKFGTETIREDGKFSTLSDTPSGWPGKTELFFETYLVLDDITANVIKDKEFVVLAGFSWTHDSGATSGSGDDDNNFGAEIAVNDAALARISTALGNAMRGGNFNGWKPLKKDGIDLQYCPEPSALLLASISALALANPRRGTVAA